MLTATTRDYGALYGSWDLMHIIQWKRGRRYKQVKGCCRLT